MKCNMHLQKPLDKYGRHLRDHTSWKIRQKQSQDSIKSSVTKFARCQLSSCSVKPKASAAEVLK